MPFVIGAVLYVLVAIPALAVVGVVCWARGRAVGRALLGGAVGSLAGFVAGCGVAALGCTAGLGARVGATAIVVPTSLGLGLLGMAAGVAILLAIQKGGS